MRHACLIPLIALVAPSLSGCNEARAPAPGPEQTVAAAAPASGTPGTPENAAPVLAPRVPAELVPPAQLLGEWRVAGVNDEPIEGPYGITASIDGQRIHIVADCIHMEWSYAAESGVIETSRVPTESCARGLTRQEELLAAALDAATGFGRTPSNAMEIFTADRRVTLYSQ